MHSVQAVLGRLVGVFPAIPTALTEDEEFDEAGQRRIVEHLVGGGAHGIWALGTGGEAPALRDRVRSAAVEVTLEATAGRIPVVVGVGDASTGRTIDRINRLPPGVDAAAVIPPYFFFHTAADLLLHFRTLLAETDIPLMIYANPWNTHNSIPVEVVAELAAEPKMVGIKDSTLDFTYMLKLLATCRSSAFRVWTGAEEFFAPTILLGGDGSVNAVGTIVPGLARELYGAAAAGDRDRALALQATFNSYVPLLSDGPGLNDAAFLGAVKEALALLGLCGRTMAAPLSPISPAHRDRVRAHLEAAGVLEAALA